MDIDNIIRDTQLDGKWTECEYSHLEYGLMQLRDECLNFIQEEWDKANEDSPLDIYIEDGMDLAAKAEAQGVARDHWLEHYLLKSKKIIIDDWHGEYFVNLTMLMEA